MARYDFKCTACGHVFETMIPMSEIGSGNNPTCPKCRCTTTIRQYSGSIQFHLKKGWHDSYNDEHQLDREVGVR